MNAGISDWQVKRALPACLFLSFYSQSVFMRIIVIGASGFAGREVVMASLRRGHEVFAIGGTQLPIIPDLKRSECFDCTDEGKLQSLILEEFPQAVINCAALSTIEACEKNLDLAQRLNVNLPRQLAQLAFHVGAKLIHFSTDMVFDGQKGRYEHTDLPRPLNHYAQTKAEGEKEVLQYGREHAAVIRTALLNGNSFRGTKSLHERLFHEWSKGRKTNLFTDEIRQPVSVSNLADMAVELCERPNLSGVYHWAGAEPLSRYAIGLKIAEHFGLDAQKLIQAGERGEVTKHDNRPQNLSMLLHPLAGKLRTPAQSLADQLGELRVPRGCEDWFEQETGQKVVRLLQKGIDF